MSAKCANRERAFHRLTGPGTSRRLKCSRHVAASSIGGGGEVAVRIGFLNTPSTARCGIAVYVTLMT
ncbi:MAG: hypothetical protein HC814_03240 [Rhodobacteraceae bacterium]|nr:hypothetical protein [Paracoccaceae bacterium]